MLNTTTKPRAERKNGSLTVLFALDVLEILSSKGTAGITEIANALGSDKSRVFRVMTSLALRGYVTQDESRKYRLGPGVGNLAEGYRHHHRLITVARSALCRLREIFKATAVLRVLDGYHVVTVAVEESSSILRITHQIGARFPLTIGAHSKVFAAHMSEDLVRHILRSQKSSVYTNKKLVNITEFVQNLRRVRKQGYGFSDEEIARGVRALAAPVSDSQGNVVATIGISLPTFELPNSKIESAAKIVRETAREVSRQLGWENTQEKGE
jgi:DNA-binding IclR family transcriptional regulator